MAISAIANILRFGLNFEQESAARMILTDFRYLASFCDCVDRMLPFKLLLLRKIPCDFKRGRGERELGLFSAGGCWEREFSVVETQCES